MSRRVVDLILEITNNMPAQDAFPGSIYVQSASHEESRGAESSTPEDPFTSMWDYIGMMEYIGTHVDTFFRMNPKGLSVDRIPLDMFLGRAVCLDMTHILERGEITAEDMKKTQEATGVKVDGHIVLLVTGTHDKYFPDKKILSVDPEIAPEAIKWLADRNSRLHGVEGPSTDIMDLNLFPSHWARRSLGITHYEWLINLTELIGKGELMFYGAPLKLEDGSGSPVRAYAIIEE